eukprot:4619086-Pleurochrysis_carterae.AAC.1
MGVLQRIGKRDALWASCVIAEAGRAVQGQTLASRADGHALKAAASAHALAYTADRIDLWFLVILLHRVLSGQGEGGFEKSMNKQVQGKRELQKEN